MRLIALMLAPILLVFLAGGCSSYQSPRVTVAGATLAERSDEAEVWWIELNLENPNPEPLELAEFDYRMSIEGDVVYRGRRSAEATLAARGSKRLTIPAVVRHDRLESAANGRSWRLSGSLLYITPGAIAEILLDSGVRKPRVRFSGNGTFPES